MPDSNEIQGWKRIAAEPPAVGESVLVLFESEFHVEDAIMTEDGVFLLYDSTEPAKAPDFWMPIPIKGLGN